MKRSGPPDRRTPLRANPEKVRAAQRKARERQIEAERRARADGRGRTLASSELVPTGLRPREVRFPVQQKRSPRKPAVVLPRSVRQAARARSNGKCVMCVFHGMQRPRKAEHLHHVLDKGLDRFRAWAADSRNLIGLCTICHGRHTNAAMVREGGEGGELRDGRVHVAALPAETMKLVAEVGHLAIDHLARHYAGTAAEPNSA